MELDVGWMESVRGSINGYKRGIIYVSSARPAV